jgi:hypothetical protein
MLLKGSSAKFWIQIFLNVFWQKSQTVAPRKTNHSFCIVTTYDSGTLYVLDILITLSKYLLMPLI